MSDSSNSSSSACLTQIHQTTVTLERTWTIARFSSHIADAVKETKCFKGLYSTPFILGYDYPSFHLSCHPNGNKEESRQFISLYLNCSDEQSINNELPINCELSLIDKNGLKANILRFQYTFSKKSYTRYGWSKFITHSKLLNDANGLLLNDQLKIQCKITLSYEDHSPSLYNPLSNYRKHQQHAPCLQKALENGQHSDVIICVNGIDIPAHKIILCAQSAVFESMFEHKDTKEAQEGKVTIEDVDVDTFKVLLKYLYSGQIPDEEQLTEKLLAASDKYLVDTLKLACEEHLTTTTTINSAAELFLFADTHNAAILKSQCLQYIVGKVDKVRLTDGWKRMVAVRPELVDEIFQRFISKIDQSFMPLLLGSD